MLFGSVAVFLLGPLTACLLPFMVCFATSVDKYELTTEGDLVCSKAGAGDTGLWPLDWGPV